MRDKVCIICGEPATRNMAHLGARVYMCSPSLDGLIAGITMTACEAFLRAEEEDFQAARQKVRRGPQRLAVR